MEAQQPFMPDAKAEAKAILHSLLKLEGALIIDAIGQCIRRADTDFAIFDSTISSKRAAEDRVGGKSLEIYYKEGVRPRLLSLCEELIKQVPGTEAQGLYDYLLQTSWTEFFSTNKSNLERITQNLRTLLDRLS